jgi:hypothetical protein
VSHTQCNADRLRGFPNTNLTVATPLLHGAISPLIGTHPPASLSIQPPRHLFATAPSVCAP